MKSELQNKETILLTGANGFLGKKIITVFQTADYEIIGTALNPGKNTIKMDITNDKEVLKVIGEIKPKIIIHTAAITNVDWCEEHKEETFKVNVEGTKNIAEASKKFSAKLILVSTDFIFDGTKKGKYVEEDRRSPLGVYSESKAAAEKIVEKELSNYLILRTSILYGYNDKDDKITFVTFVKKKLEENNKFEAYINQFGNPTLIDDIGIAIIKLLELGETGIYNIVGREHLNRLEFAKKIARAFNLDESLITPGTWNKTEHSARRPEKIESSIKKLESKNITMSNIEEGLKKMRNQMQEN